MIGVSDDFHKAAFGQIIRPEIRLSMSFNKNLREGTFFTLNKSKLDGSDLLKFKASDADTQSWNFYDYVDYSDRIVSCEWERSLEFPYSIQCGMADFVLSDTDGFFTPLNPSSSIGENNLPARPVKFAAGFNYANYTELVPQFTGITEGMPRINENSETTSFHAVDFLYDICNRTLTATIDMREVRTDEVIAAILRSYGLSPTQYKLGRGMYTIPFVFFDIGESIGEALKQLVQSENGYMWLDEEGIVRFESAISSSFSTGIEAKLTDYDIVNITTGDLSDIVNHVRITADLREVQEYQEVYAKASSGAGGGTTSYWAINPGESLTVTCGLSDPCYDIVAPTLGKASSVSWFTAQDTNGTNVGYGVTATGVLSSTAYTITFTNNTGLLLAIDELVLWGQPAKVYNQLKYDAYDDESVEKYGDQILEITNNQFFQSYDQANRFARTLIGQHKDYTRTINAEIKGDFSFQLKDLIEIETSDGAYNGVYQIQGISYTMSAGSLTTTLKLNGTSIKPGVFTLNISKLNGEDLIQ